MPENITHDFEPGDPVWYGGYEHVVTAVGEKGRIWLKSARPGAEAAFGGVTHVEFVEPRQSWFEYRVSELESHGGLVWAMDRRLVNPDGFAYPWREHCVYHDQARAEADAVAFSGEPAV